MSDPNADIGQNDLINDLINQKESGSTETSALLNAKFDSKDIEIHQLRSNILFWLLVVYSFYTFCQLLIGILSAKSLVVSSDSVFMIIDTCTYFFNLYSSSNRHYIGLEPLSAIVSSSILIFMSIIIIIVSFIMLFYPVPHPDSFYIIFFAFCNIIIDSLFFYKLSPLAEDSVNVKSAFLHLISDLLRSLAMILDGLLVWFGIYIADSWMSLVIAIGVGYYAIQVLNESIIQWKNEINEKIDINEIEYNKNSKGFNINSEEEGAFWPQLMLS